MFKHFGAMRFTCLRNITLLGLCVGILGACVQKSTYNEVVAENAQLKTQVQRTGALNNTLTQYVDSILPLLTLNQPRSIRDRVFPMVVKLARETDLPSTSSQKLVPPPTEEEEKILQTLKGELVTLTTEGELHSLNVSEEASLQTIQEELKEYQEYLWKTDGETYSMVLPQSKFFSYGSVRLNNSGLRILSGLSRRFRFLTGYNIVIESHTDDREASTTRQVNNPWSLTALRAATLAQYLSEAGVAGKHLIPIGMGDSKPFTTQNPGSESSKNRRIEIILRPKSKN